MRRAGPFSLETQILQLLKFFLNYLTVSPSSISFCSIFLEYLRKDIWALIPSLSYEFLCLCALVLRVFPQLYLPALPFSFLFFIPIIFLLCSLKFPLIVFCSCCLDAVFSLRIQIIFFLSLPLCAVSFPLFSVCFSISMSYVRGTPALFAHTLGTQKCFWKLCGSEWGLLWTVGFSAASSDVGLPHLEEALFFWHAWL